MSSPFEQRPAQIPSLQPQRHQPKATISTWITAAVVLLFMVFGIKAGGFGGALVILAISLFVTGLYALLTGRPSWLRLPSRRVGGATSGAAVAILIIGAMLLPPAEDGNGTAAGRNQTVQVTKKPTQTSQATTSAAEASARASADASAEADAEASSAAAQETAKAEAEAAAEAKVAADAEAKVKAEAEAATKAQADAEAKAKADADAKAAAAKAAEEAGTFSQQNALKAAKNYLSLMAFSYPGLISQLEYEQYSTEDATWAVDRMTVDWNLQAAKSAKNYLANMAFSRAGLVDQLIYEGFTPEQAEYGVSQTGL